METLVIVRENNYWGAGKTDQEAKANYKRSCGKKATGGAIISTFVGADEELDRITIDDVDGTICYPKTVEKK